MIPPFPRAACARPAPLALPLMTPAARGIPFSATQGRTAPPSLKLQSAGGPARFSPEGETRKNPTRTHRISSVTTFPFASLPKSCPATASTSMARDGPAPAAPVHVISPGPLHDAPHPTLLNFPLDRHSGRPSVKAMNEFSGVPCFPVGFSPVLRPVGEREAIPTGR